MQDSILSRKTHAGGEIQVEAMIGNVDRISMEEILYALRNLREMQGSQPDGVIP